MAKVVLFLVLLCTLLMPHHSYGTGEEGYLGGNLDVHNLRNRKVVGGMEIIKKVVVVKKVEGMYEEKQKEGAESGRELREAPMGPDPLHHNGAPPRKPIRTTP